MAPPAVGQPAPAFSLKTTGGESISLSDFLGNRVVLYFYPKDDTPGCTKEACAFQEGRVRFKKRNTVVLGVSGDDIVSHERFAQKFGLTFPLLSDPGYVVCKAYGVYKQKALYGRTFLGIERTTLLIDEQGRISTIFSKVRVDGHLEEVLAALTAETPADGSRSAPARSRAH
ncbi:MAG: peroxiredoxin [Candidatus Omnitrophota bacterium]|nr:peroxiredoxin [Candidatus Omnitrophota bacterium]